MLAFATDPTAPSGVCLIEVDEPRPKADEAVVEVAGFAINRGELSLIKMRTNGFRPGQDVSGVVAKAAEDGSSPPVGTRVVGLSDDSSWAERVVVPGQRLGVVPAGVDLAQMSTAPASGLTALRALGVAGPLLGGNVLITGASGGVGGFAIQLAAIAGARVTALVSGEHRFAVVTDWGAAEAVTAIDEHSGPFDLVLDGMGGPVLAAAIRRLADHGVAASYGMTLGEPTTVSPADFRAAPNSCLRGFFLWATDLPSVGRDLSYLARLVDEKRLELPVGLDLDWRETPKGLAALANREVVGKVVLRRD